MILVSGRVRAASVAVLVAGVLAACSSADSAGSARESATVAWDDSRSYLRQDSAWYSTADAIQIADDLLWYQQASGGWPNLHQRIRTLGDDSVSLPQQKERTDAWIIATARKLNFLTRVHEDTGLERFGEPIARGIDYLVSTQYANGGLPKVFPDTSYRDGRDSSHNPRGRVPLISLNDGAMPLAMMELLTASRAEDGYAFLDEERRAAARRAVEAGIEAFLKLQIVSEGRRTGWAQQYDEVTMEPRWGRKFEPKAIAARETIDVLRFLVQIENPSPEVVAAVQDAVRWLDEVKLTGIREEIAEEPTEVDNWNGTIRFTDRHDRWIVKDPEAPPMWAHFYEIGTDRPVFASEDDTIRYNLVDISLERRTGYQWYGYWPQSFFENEYAAWLERNRLPTALESAGTGSAGGAAGEEAS